MAVENFKQKFEALVSEEPSKWLEKAQWRADNRGWIKISQAIAIRINRILREKQITQKALADILNVSPQQISKIVKGRENLTLETISKLENALETTIIAVPRQSMHSKYQTETNINTILDKKTELGKKKKNLSEMEAEYVQSDEKPNRYKIVA